MESRSKHTLQSGMKRFVRFFTAMLLCICVINTAEAFDFERDVAAKFFWTKSYKKAHPAPTNNMPKTMQEYYREVNKAAAKNMQTPSPKFEKDDKLVDLPDPELFLRKYNNPPGTIDINLNSLKKKRQINSIGVVSPQYDKMVYSTVFYYPSTKTASSELYLMNLDMDKDIQSRIEDAHINHGKTTIYRTEMDSLDLDIQKTLTVLDWSADGKQIAFKEKISFTPEGLWKTNLIVYNLETGSIKELSEVRGAIEYYWRQHNLNLKNYRWDIYPMGWDSINPERIIVFAYAATGEKPKYLGAWSVDYKGDRAMLMSLTSTDFTVTQNGSCLRTRLKN